MEDRSKAKIATTGRVKVRADARRNPIRAGDLLLGGSERMAVPLTKSGEGEILLLLSLQ